MALPALFDLTGQTALITGSSRGIGKAIVLALRAALIFPAAAALAWAVLVYLGIDFGFVGRFFSVRPEIENIYRAGAEAVIRSASADWLSEPISSASSSSSGRIFCRPVTTDSSRAAGATVCSAISRSATTGFLSRSRSMVSSLPPEISRARCAARSTWAVPRTTNGPSQPRWPSWRPGAAWWCCGR
mgnify:CR=1 FL=1